MSIDDLKTKYADELNTIKGMLEISDTGKDTMIVLAIDKAYKTILNYTGWLIFDMEYIASVYSLAIAYYTNDCLKYKKAKGEHTITQQTQGSRSVSFGENQVSIDSDGLTQDVKSMLPLPLLKVVG